MRWSRGEAGAIALFLGLSVYFSFTGPAWVGGAIFGVLLGSYGESYIRWRNSSAAVNVRRGGGG